MKFYEVRHYNANYPGRDKILAYKGIVLFKYKGKLLCYLKPLKNKTKGNISVDAEKLLTQFLSDLRLNYVDEIAKK